MLAEAVLAALKGFADEVATWTNQGSLISIGTHIAQIENAVVQDVHAGETAAKGVLAELYGAFHGHPVTPVVAAPAPVAEAPIAEPAPVAAPVVEPVAAPVAVDPTPAPSTTVEASSAPSSTPSTSTEIPAPAAPTA